MEASNNIGPVRVLMYCLVIRIIMFTVRFVNHYGYKFSINQDLLLILLTIVYYLLFAIAIYSLVNYALLKEVENDEYVKKGLNLALFLILLEPVAMIIGLTMS